MATSETNNFLVLNSIGSLLTLTVCLAAISLNTFAYFLASKFPFSKTSFFLSKSTTEYV